LKDYKDKKNLPAASFVLCVLGILEVLPRDFLPRRLLGGQRSSSSGFLGPGGRLRRPITPRTSWETASRRAGSTRSMPGRPGTLPVSSSSAERPSIPASCVRVRRGGALAPLSHL